MTQKPKSLLYEKLTQQLRDYWTRLLDDEKHGLLIFPPSELDEIARVLFSNLKKGGIATFVVTGRKSWDPQSYYFEASRNAARRGCVIKRAFLLPHRLYMNDETLQLHWRLDIAAGIEVVFLYVGDFLPTLLFTPSFGLDFGLWDDELVCTNPTQIILGTGEADKWRISIKGEDIELAKSLWAELLQKTVTLAPPGEDYDSLNLEEPLVHTARLMDLLSDAVCNRSYISADDCSWYHGVWQYLRIFDLVSTPTWHPDFYTPQLKSFASGVQDRAKILISGTADYSTLAHVIHAFELVNKEFDVIIVDLCQTPLIICQWYARSRGYKIATIQDSLTSFKGEDFTYDAIVTDAFLTRFPQEEHAKIIERWFQLLKPGGYVFTTVRIHGSGVGEKVVTHPKQVNIFRSLAFEQAKRWQDFLLIKPEQVAIKAQRYAERMVSYRIASPNEVRDLFDQQGFTCEHYKLTNVKGEMSPTQYLELAVKKPLTDLKSQ